MGCSRSPGRRTLRHGVAACLVASSIFALGTGSVAAGAARPEAVRAGDAPGSLVVTPATGIVAGTSVDVSVSAEANTQVSVAQCGSPIGSDRSASRCGAALTVALGADGTGPGRLHVDQWIATRSGPVDCLAQPCPVVLFGPSGDALTSTTIELLPPYPPLAVAVTPADGLTNGQTVDLHVTGQQNLPVDLFQCEASIAGTRQPADPDAPCAPLAHVDAGGALRVARSPVATAVSATSGAWPCGKGPTGCVIAAVTADGRHFATAPITFATPATATLSPSSELVDGQAVELTASGLRPGATYRVLHCAHPQLGIGSEYPCEDAGQAPQVVASAAGTVAVATAAWQRVPLPSGGSTHCRAGCHIALLGQDEDARGIEALAGYALAGGELAASPAENLVDGETVTVAGTGLMATYDGPPIWIFQAGSWGVLQCDGVVAEDLTVLGLFSHCAIPPSGTTVSVAGSELSTQVVVRSSIDKILGGTTDCEAVADACVLVLSRLEEGMFAPAAHLVALSFASSGPGPS
jgi:hypothetical protein